jgi:hypothetical protein
MNIYTEKCMSVKSKKNMVQCTYKRKKDSEYCGIHSRSKNIIRIDKLEKKENKVIHKKIKVITNNHIEDLPIHSLEKVLQTDSINTIQTSQLKKLVNKFHSKDLVPLHTFTKRSLVEHLQKYYQKYEYYHKNLDKIIKAQSVIRRFLVIKRKECINDDDLCTTHSKYEIPPTYYFSFRDEKEFKYCFDMRSFSKLIESPNPTNPYTMKPITKDVINNFKNRLVHDSIKLDFDSDDATPDQAFRHKAIEVFHKYDMLDNYTDHTWFMDLSIDQLKNFYAIAKDIWIYRSQLTKEQQDKIVKNGIAFEVPMHFIQKLKINQKRKLQYIVLNELDRFVSEGIDINERKLGAMLMLTALVEVSTGAAAGLPHLVQHHI